MPDMDEELSRATYEVHVRLHGTEEWQGGLLPYGTDETDKNAVLEALQAFRADHPEMYDGAVYRVVFVQRTVVALLTPDAVI